MPFRDLVGNTLATARTIVLDGTSVLNGEYIEAPTDLNDYYTFTNSTSATFIRLSGLSDDLNVQLLDRNGTLLRDSTNTGITEESLVIRTPGTYYLRVYAAHSNTVSPYTLSVNTSEDIGDFAVITPEQLANRRIDRTTQQVLWQYGTTFQTEAQPIFQRPSGFTRPAPDGWQLAASGLWDYRNPSSPTRLFGPFPDVPETSNIAIFRNQITGQNQLRMWDYILDLPTVPDLNWQIGGVGDFNGDGSFDLIWRNRATGENLFWLSRIPSVTINPNFGSEYFGSYWTGQDVNFAFSTINTLPLSDGNWSIVGTGDFNGDRQSDLVWRNQATGQNVLWLMSGIYPVQGVDVLGLSLDWELATAGDFDQDGATDLIWYNRNSGQHVWWKMEGTTPIVGIDLPSSPDPNWRIRGVANDFAEALVPEDVYTSRALVNLGILDGAATIRDRVSLSDMVDDFAFRVDSSSSLSFSLSDLTSPVKMYLFKSSSYRSIDDQVALIESGVTPLPEPVSYETVLSIASGATPASTGLTAGNYVLRIVRTTANTNYQLNLLASPNPAQILSRYTYTYYTNGIDNGGDYYTGYGYAAIGTYTPGIYNIPSAGNPGNPSGRYQIHKVETVNADASQIGRVYASYSTRDSINPYYQSFYLGPQIYGRQGLGSERTYRRPQYSFTEPPFTQP
jgi:hypothetical protein